MNTNDVKETIRSLVKKLVEHKYEEIYHQDHDKAISVLEIQEAIDSYGQILSMPPDDAFDEIDIYETKDPSKVTVDFDLWFNNEKSDLTLSCIVYSAGQERSYSIENIHML